MKGNNNRIPTHNRGKTMSNSKFDEWAFDQTVTKGGAIFGCKDKDGVNVGFVNTGTGEYFSLSDGDKWISVDVRLPEIMPYRLAPVLIAREDGSVSWAAYNTKIEKFLTESFKDIEENHKVTHWQALPVGPK
jgi:hypothetical protein